MHSCNSFSLVFSQCFTKCYGVGENILENSPSSQRVVCLLKTEHDWLSVTWKTPSEKWSNEKALQIYKFWNLWFEPLWCVRSVKSALGWWPAVARIFQVWLLSPSLPQGGRAGKPCTVRKWDSAAQTACGEFKVPCLQRTVFWIGDTLHFFLKWNPRWWLMLFFISLFF